MKISTNFPLSFIIQSLKRVSQINRNQPVLLPIGAVALVILIFMNPGAGLAQIPNQATVISSIPGDVQTVLKFSEATEESVHLLGTPAELNEDGLCDSGYITFELDDNVPAFVQLPMSYAASLVNEWINLVDTVRISCSYTAAASPTNLASAGAAEWYQIEGLLGLYPSALAKQIAIGADNYIDISMNINSNWPSWYFGIDGNCPAGQTDLVTVLLHEMLHGFGFQNRSGIGEDGEPFVATNFGVWEFHLADAAGNMIWTVDYGVENAWEQYTDSALFFSGPEVSANLESNPMLFAPSTFQPGSSIAHLDESTYLGNNALMTPVLGSSQVWHTPGEIGMWMLADLGYNINYAPGCTDATACNYDPDASFNDGTCSYDPPVCMNPAGCNYDPTGICHDPATCTMPPVIYLPNDPGTGLTSYIPCNVGATPPDNYHSAYDQAAAWQIIMDDFDCAEEWTIECHALYVELACGMSLAEQANNQPVELDLSNPMFDEPLVVYCEEYFDGIEEAIVQEIINAIDFMDECPESVRVEGIHEYTYTCGPHAGGMNIFLYFVDVLGEVTPWSGFVNIVDQVPPSIELPQQGSDNVLAANGLPDPSDESAIVDFLIEFLLPTTDVSDNCTPDELIDEFVDVEVQYLGLVNVDGVDMAQFSVIATDACGNASQSVGYIYDLYNPDECGWYLPDALGGGPAVQSCEPIDGYTWAANQACAEEVASVDSFCTGESWDSVCQTLYAACYSGCTDETACNFDADATDDDGSCIEWSWVIPEDPGSGLPAVQWCSLVPMPEGYALANQSCADYVTEIDDYCDGTSWDGICQTSYEGCLELQPGCLDATACNYDPESGDGNASCIYPGETCSEATACYTTGVYTEACECVADTIDTDGDGICDGDEIAGCTDAQASNYDPAATDEDGSCFVPGCKEPSACNYDPAATVDDGSCAFPGDLCMMPSECNSEGYYDENCNCMFDGPGDSDGDGVCDDAEVLGCMDVTALNYNPEATDDDGSCLIEGCKEPEACNFDPEANIDDGTCTFPGDFCMEATACNGEGFFDADCNCVFEGAGDADGDGVCDDACPAYEFTGCMDEEALNYNPFATLPATCIYLENGGCIDELACNYNPQATFDAGGCMYPEAPHLDCDGQCLFDYDGDGVCDELEVLGCMDPEALNFNPYATNAWGEDAEGACFYAYINGCMDEAACNYNPDANHDGGGCMYPENAYVDCYGNCLFDYDGDGVCDDFEVLGCMDPEALNFNPYATNSWGEGAEGACFYAYINGCMDEAACNYNSDANHDGGGCMYPENAYVDCYGNCLFDYDGDGVCDDFEVFGCMDPEALNYNPYATNTSGGGTEPVCFYAYINGCMDEIACNFNPDANHDGGGCTYPENAYVDCDGNCLDDYDGDGVCNDFEVFGCMDPEALNYNPYATNTSGGGTEPVCFYAYINGCMDENACNFNPDANHDGGGCTYPLADYLDCSGECLNDFNGDGVCDELDIFGCMDAEAVNYNPHATVTSGLDPEVCIYPYVNGCMEPSACNYHPEATFDNGTCYYAVAEYADCEGACLSDTDGDGVCDELEVPGCTDPNAVNFEAWATDDNGACTVPISSGCTYPTASNYDENADFDNGSCTFDTTGSNACPNDIDGDGTVAVSDLLLLLSSYGTTCE